MSFGKLSDDFADDCWTLSDAAFRTHVEGLTWNARKLLDCRIPKDDVRRFAKQPDAIDELLAAGYWTDDGDHYVIRHHAQYQPTREREIARQTAARENGRKGGRPRKNTPQAGGRRERFTPPETQPLTQPGTRLGSPTANPGDNPEGEVRSTSTEHNPYVTESTHDNNDDVDWPEVDEHLRTPSGATR